MQGRAAVDISMERDKQMVLIKTVQSIPFKPPGAGPDREILNSSWLFLFSQALSVFFSEFLAIPLVNS